MGQKMMVELHVRRGLFFFPLACLFLSLFSSTAGRPQLLWPELHLHTSMIQRWMQVLERSSLANPFCPSSAQQNFTGIYVAFSAGRQPWYSCQCRADARVIYTARNGTFVQAKMSTAPCYPGPSLASQNAVFLRALKDSIKWAPRISADEQAASSWEILSVARADTKATVDGDAEEKEEAREEKENTAVHTVEPVTALRSMHTRDVTQISAPLESRHGPCDDRIGMTVNGTCNKIRMHAPPCDNILSSVNISACPCPLSSPCLQESSPYGMQCTPAPCHREFVDCRQVPSILSGICLTFRGDFAFFYLQGGPLHSS